MPAAKSMASQEKKEYSGSSSSRPSLMRPVRVKPMKSMKNTAAVESRMKNHPVFSVTQASAVEETAERLSVPSTPQAMKPTISRAVMMNTALSVENRTLRSSTPTPGTSAGWMPWGYVSSSKICRGLLRVVDPAEEPWWAGGCCGSDPGECGGVLKTVLLTAAGECAIS